jgi:hypothetical protein
MKHCWTLWRGAKARLPIVIIKKTYLRVTTHV